MTKDFDKRPAGPVAATIRKPPRAVLEWSEAGVLQIDLAGDWNRIIAAAANENVYFGLLAQTAILGSHGKKTDSHATDFVLGYVDAMRPQDAAEVLLSAQMAATHQATMAMARRLNHVENIRQQDAAERALNKLARTFASQMDTLKRYRSKGQQVVRVERVTVQDGGQAIVGSVQTGGRGHDES